MSAGWKAQARSVIPRHAHQRVVFGFSAPSYNYLQNSGGTIHRLQPNSSGHALVPALLHTFAAELDSAAEPDEQLSTATAIWWPTKNAV